MPLYDSSFDVELVSNIVFKLKRGKAVAAEHLLFCHPVYIGIIVKLFNLIISTRYSC